MMRSGLFCGLLLAMIITATLLLSSGCTTPEGDVADGKRWYRMHNCFACHGDNGYDGRGPNIAGLDMGYHAFIHRLRNTKTQIMPVFNKEKINDQDAADILAYLKSIKK